MWVLMVASRGRYEAPSLAAEIIPEELAAVLILVAIQAQILPVGAIRGVIPWIAIFMMHC
jgi:hypothetical protein